MNSSRLESLKAFLAKDDKDSFSRYALAMEYVKLNQLDPALEQFARLIQDDPGYVAAYYHMGKTLEAADRGSEALDVYQKGLAAAKKKNDHHAASELQQALDELQDSM